MLTNPQRGHKVKILKIFDTIEKPSKRGVVSRYTPFTWCLLFQGGPILHFNGWSIRDGKISPPQRKSGKRYWSQVTMTERMVNRLYEALADACPALVNPYRPAAVEWLQDPWFESRCSEVSATEAADELAKYAVKNADALMRALNMEEKDLDN